MTLAKAMALVGIVFVLCYVLIPFIFADIPSFRRGVDIGMLLDLLVRFLILGFFLEIIRRIFTKE